MTSRVYLLLLPLLIVATKADVAAPIPLPDIEGLWCYTCQDFTANDTWCRGANNLLSNQAAVRRLSLDERLLNPHYGTRSCGTWFPYCVIAQLYSANDSSRSAYLRDCSNGEEFSFTFMDGSRLTVNTTGTRLGAHLFTGTRAPSNRTLCMWSGEGQVQVCASLCSGDFCNGPQLQRLEDSVDDGSGGCGRKDGCTVVLSLVVLALMLLGIV